MDNHRNEKSRELDMVASDYRGGFEMLSAFPTNRHNPIGWRGFNTDGGDQSAKDEYNQISDTMEATSSSFFDRCT